MELSGQPQSTNEELTAKKLLEEKEADGKLRIYNKPLSNVITVLFIIWSVFQIYANTLGSIDA